jgi:organic hydroperoxide reductase OsmC/OhrA
MSEHRATIFWQRTGEEFAKGRYSREHIWKFDGGATIPASPSPSVVPAPYSNPASVDPEEAFIASIASCHMLFFVDFARRNKFVVDSYEDEAVGTLAKLDSGDMWVSEVKLNPRIVFSGETKPTPEQEEELHHRAHKACFIANSVRSEVRWG